MENSSKFSYYDFLYQLLQSNDHDSIKRAYISAFAKMNEDEQAQVYRIIRDIVDSSKDIIENKTE